MRRDASDLDPTARVVRRRRGGGFRSGPLDLDPVVENACVRRAAEGDGRRRSAAASGGASHGIELGARLRAQAAQT
jgi:hypothetical protein